MHSGVCANAETEWFMVKILEESFSIFKYFTPVTLMLTGITDAGRKFAKEFTQRIGNRM